MAFYRLRPYTVDAIQFMVNDFDKVFCFTEGRVKDLRLNEKTGISYCTVSTFAGDRNVTEGDYIIRGVDGEYYPCRKGIFEEAYEIAE